MHTEVINCDLCSTTADEVIIRDTTDTALGTPGRFAIVRCRSCGLVFLTPQPAAEEIAASYPFDYDPYRPDGLFLSAVKRLLAFPQRLQLRRIRKKLGRIGDLLEVGCARGDLLRSLANEWRCNGIEMDVSSAAAASRGGGLTVWRGKFEEFMFPPEQQFDCILMNFVLEHLPSPREALMKTQILLRPGGYAVISIPNYDSWERRIFAQYWHCFDVPRHFTIFTQSAMRRLAAETGFSVKRLTYSMVPNDWVGSIGRMLRAYGLPTFARLFSYKNVPLALIFLPLSIAGALARKSSRFTFILHKHL